MRPLLSVPLKFGSIAGVLGAILDIGLYYIGRHPFLIPVFFDFRIFIFAVFIFFTLKELRDFRYGGILYFWQGLFGSFVFTSVFAVIASSGIALFAWLVPAFVSQYVSLSLDQLKNLPPEVIQQIGKSVYDRNLQMLPATNGIDLAVLYFTQSYMIGFFISIILSVILRRQPKT